MGKHNLDVALDAFQNADNIDASYAGNHGLLVKVMEESAIGDFFRICREMDLERDDTTRNCLPTCVMDSWVDSK